MCVKRCLGTRRRFLDKHFDIVLMREGDGGTTTPGVQGSSASAGGFEGTHTSPRAGGGISIASAAGTRSSSEAPAERSSRKKHRFVRQKTRMLALTFQTARRANVYHAVSSRTRIEQSRRAVFPSGGHVERRGRSPGAPPKANKVVPWSSSQSHSQEPPQNTAKKISGMPKLQRRISASEDDLVGCGGSAPYYTALHDRREEGQHAYNAFLPTSSSSSQRSAGRKGRSSRGESMFSAEGKSAATVPHHSRPSSQPRISPPPKLRSYVSLAEVVPLSEMHLRSASAPAVRNHDIPACRAHEDRPGQERTSMNLEKDKAVGKLRAHVKTWQKTRKEMLKAAISDIDTACCLVSEQPAAADTAGGKTDDARPLRPSSNRSKIIDHFPLPGGGPATPVGRFSPPHHASYSTRRAAPVPQTTRLETRTPFRLLQYEMKKCAELQRERKMVARVHDHLQMQLQIGGSIASSTQKKPSRRGEEDLRGGRPRSVGGGPYLLLEGRHSAVAPEQDSRYGPGGRPPPLPPFRPFGSSVGRGSIGSRSGGRSRPATTQGRFFSNQENRRGSNSRNSRRLVVPLEEFLVAKSSSYHPPASAPSPMIMRYEDGGADYRGRRSSSFRGGGPRPRTTSSRGPREHAAERGSAPSSRKNEIGAEASRRCRSREKPVSRESGRCRSASSKNSTRPASSQMSGVRTSPTDTNFHEGDHNTPIDDPLSLAGQTLPTGGAVLSPGSRSKFVSKNEKHVEEGILPEGGAFGDSLGSGGSSRLGSAASIDQASDAVDRLSDQVRVELSTHHLNIELVSTPKQICFLNSPPPPPRPPKWDTSTTKTRHQHVSRRRGKRTAHVRGESALTSVAV